MYLQFARNTCSFFNSEKRKEVIHLLPQVPTKTYSERKRFMDLFEYDVDFVIQRMSSIKRELGDYFDWILKRKTEQKEKKTGLQNMRLDSITSKSHCVGSKKN